MKKKIIKMKWNGTGESVLVDARKGKGKYLPGDIVELFDSTVVMICGLTVKTPSEEQACARFFQSKYLVITNEEMKGDVLYIRDLDSIIKILTPSPLRSRK